MVQYAINTTQGASMSFFGISQALQRELEKTFSEEACSVLLSLAEEIYKANSSEAQKVFDDHKEVLVLSIAEKLREVFSTREELNAKNAQLRSEMQAEFAKVRQEMAEMKLELKQEIAEIKGDNKLLRKEMRYAAIGIAALMILLQPKVFDFITHLLK